MPASSANRAIRAAVTACARGPVVSLTSTRRPGTTARRAMKAPGGPPGSSGWPAIPRRKRRRRQWVPRMPVARFWKTHPAATFFKPDSAGVPGAVPFGVTLARLRRPQPADASGNARWPRGLKQFPGCFPELCALRGRRRMSAQTNT